MRLVRGLVLLAALGAGCGDAAPRKAPPPPVDPLEAARIAQREGDEAALALHLAEAERLDGEPGRVATTWAFQRALAAQDPEGALLRLTRIVERFDGVGTDARGRDWASPLLAEALVRAAAEAARGRVEGRAPDPAAARRALDAGRAAAALGSEDDAEGVALLAMTHRWIELGEAPVGARLAAVGIPTAEGARVLVVTDAHEIEEPVLAGVLRRWAKDLPVVVVGRRSGHVREGARRVPASREEEDRALAASIAAARAVRAAILEPERLVGAGFPAEGASVLLIGKDDRIVGRMSGRALDPRPLDPLFERLLR